MPRRVLAELWLNILPFIWVQAPVLQRRTDPQIVQWWWWKILSDLCWQMVKPWSMKFNYCHCLRLSTVLRACLEPEKEGVNRKHSNFLFWLPSQTSLHFNCISICSKCQFINFNTIFIFFQTEKLIYIIRSVFSRMKTEVLHWFWGTRIKEEDIWLGQCQDQWEAQCPCHDTWIDDALATVEVMAQLLITAEELRLHSQYQSGFNH